MYIKDLPLPCPLSFDLIKVQNIRISQWKYALLHCIIIDMPKIAADRVTDS